MIDIPRATEIREQTPYTEGFDKAVASVVRDIRKASAEGRRKCCFNPPAYWYTTKDGIRTFINYEEEVKELFRSKGYTFRPTGYIGGVWQRTENICW